MSQVFYLNAFRQKKKQQFLEKNKTFLDDYIRSYVAAHCFLSYEVFRHKYFEHCQSFNEMAWDYLDFRDILTEAISQVLGEQLWQDIQGQAWFNPQFLSRDEVLDRLISIYIIGAAVSGIDG